MPNTETGIPPVITLSVANAVKTSGLSRSELYRQLAASTIKAVKIRTRTLILMDSLTAFIASMKPATFRPLR